MEQGRPFTLGETGPQTLGALAVLQHAVDAQVKDWETFTRQATEFHLKNARAWASTATGQDLATQIDPALCHGGPLAARRVGLERLQPLHASALHIAPAALDLG
jgi:CO dehydrogenase maturation factor